MLGILAIVIGVALPYLLFLAGTIATEEMETAERAEADRGVGV
jgi:hypothetical protein